MSPPPPVPVIPIAASPLSPEQFAQWQAAGLALRKINRAAAVANFDGWSIAIFAALTFMFGYTDVTTIIIALVMGAVAAVELRYAIKLRALDLTAARTLAVNQLALAAMLIAYALWRITAVLRGGATSALLGHLDPQIAELLGGDFDDFLRQVSLLLYGSLIAIAILCQGGMALYYAARAKHVRRIKTEIPDWIVTMQLQSAGG